jgi:hypothetical protein
MAKEILDQWGGVVSYIADGNEDGEIIVGRYQDARPILDHNAALRSAGDGGYVDRDRDLRRVASIPLTLAEQWVQEAGLRPGDFWKWPKAAQNEFFRRRYRSSDYRNLLTS